MRYTAALAVALSAQVVVLVVCFLCYLVKVIDNGPGEGTAQEERRLVRRICGSLRSMFARVFPLTAVKIVIVVWQIISQVRRC